MVAVVGDGEWVCEEIMVGGGGEADGEKRGGFQSRVRPYLVP
jgi:hypothetical protein